MLQSKQTKAFVYQLVSFAILFFPSRYLINNFTGLTGIWIPVTAFVIATILAPKFQAVKTAQGEKLFVSWVFFKGLKEIK